VIRAEARRRSVEVTIICDFIGVLGCLSRATWSFLDVFSSPERVAGCHEVRAVEKGLAVLEGNAGLAASAITPKPTALRLDGPKRKKTDERTRYYKNKRPYLDYPKTLEAGYPIATAVIEGACRHLVRDPFDTTTPR
jgi:hypothetical protein